MQSGIAGCIDLAHPALAKGSDDLIRTQGRAGRKGHGVVRGIITVEIGGRRAALAQTSWSPPTRVDLVGAFESAPDDPGNSDRRWPVSLNAAIPPPSASRAYNSATHNNGSCCRHAPRCL